MRAHTPTHTYVHAHKQKTKQFLKVEQTVNTVRLLSIQMTLAVKNTFHFSKEPKKKQNISRNLELMEISQELDLNSY